MEVSDLIFYGQTVSTEQQQQNNKILTEWQVSDSYAVHTYNAIVGGNDEDSSTASSVKSVVACIPKKTETNFSYFQTPVFVFSASTVVTFQHQTEALSLPNWKTA